MVHVVWISTFTLWLLGSWCLFGVGSLPLKTCADCKWFQILNEQEKNGECFRYPPTAFLNHVQMRTHIDPTPKMMTQRTTYYPIVSYGSRECGEFKPYIESVL